MRLQFLRATGTVTGSKYLLCHAASIVNKFDDSNSPSAGRGFDRPRRQVFVTHGEPAAADAMTVELG